MFTALRFPILLSACICSLGAQSSWLGETFIDPTDGQLDMSNWLLEKKGFLPVPIIITEPAVGYGGGAALVYFHDKFGGQDGKPSVSALAAAGTENGTWFAGGGHMGIWKDDTIRYIGAAGVAHVEMQYYGFSGAADNKLNSSISFETDALFLLQELQFRLGNSNFFAGASYTIADTSNAFNINFENLPNELPSIDFDSRSAALSAMISYDSRNNMFSPSNGLSAKLKASSFNQNWGSDENYWSYSGVANYYTELSPNWMLGTRLSGKAVDGDAPFYAYPYIDLRGVKAMQYQGDQTLLTEIELNWRFHPRWTLVGFGGVGKAFNEGIKQDSEVIYSKGGGFRYLIARQLGLQMGLDIAKGPDDTAIYVQVGSAWVLK